MNLRKLNRKDAPFMLEWMHDPIVVKYLQTDFATKAIKDCEKFIADSSNHEHSLHLAVVDESDTYQGTVSLKYIKDDSAEFAITIRSSAMGLGYSVFAMEKMINIGFERLNLISIYWYVNPENKRAVRFYEKNGYRQADPDMLHVIRWRYSNVQIQTYNWYLIRESDWRKRYNPKCHRLYT